MTASETDRHNDPTPRQPSTPPTVTRTTTAPRIEFVVPPGLDTPADVLEWLQTRAPSLIDQLDKVTIHYESPQP